MKILGVTGPSGAGKTLFCSYLKEMGCAILDCDEIYHDLTDMCSECTLELKRFFGPEILRKDGSLDRRKLAPIVFELGARDKLEMLNKITHKYVIQETLDRLSDLKYSDNPPKIAVIDAPLLFQAGMEKYCDKTVCLLAGVKLQLKRLSERDGMPEGYLKDRLAAMPDDSFYSDRADIVLVNDEGTEKLRQYAEEVVRTVCEEG